MKKLVIEKSNIEGKGIFLAEDAHKGEHLAFIKGKLIHKRNHGAEDALANPNWIGVSKNFWINPSLPFNYVNHSCNPTAGIKGRKNVIALRDLKAGTEVTIDYGTTEVDPEWYMNCSCGEKNCRKVVKSIIFLPKRTFLSYLPGIPTYFKKFYTEKIFKK